ncbi:MAG TPA: pitrilysin family protein [Polyangiaceae bacterium]|nr:pitrilysin family protein [Polyangiaceae bacterium]
MPLSRVRPLASSAVIALCASLVQPAVSQEAPSQEAPSQQAQPGPIAKSSFEIPFEKYALDNGLEVILARDPSLPRVAVNIWYHVGPANEPPKRSGFAHLFEHLMFEGSKYAGRQFDTLIEAAGGTNVNGTTSFDRTNYFETVPSEQLELVLWLESDRMGFMIDALTPDRLEVQRGVVLNERRQSYENRPYGPSELTLYDTFFPPGHPYHGNVIGSIEDLNHATFADVRAFFDAYYAPSNATLAVVGDFDVERTKQLIERYFAPLRKRPKPERRQLVTEPRKEPVRREVPENVSLAKVTMAWLVPPAFGPEEPGLELAGHVLGSGKASRLYQDLVVTELATQVDSWLDDNEYGGVLALEALVSSGVPVERVEKAMEASVAKLASSGPTSDELSRAKKGLLVQLSSSLQLLNGGAGDAGRAGVLQKLNHYLGDPGRLPSEMLKLQAVEPAEVQRRMQAYMAPQQRVVVVTLPKPAASTDEKPAAGEKGKAP